MVPEQGRQRDKRRKNILPNRYRFYNIRKSNIQLDYPTLDQRKLISTFLFLLFLVTISSYAITVVLSSCVIFVQAEITNDGNNNNNSNNDTSQNDKSNNVQVIKQNIFIDIQKQQQQDAKQQPNKDNQNKNDNKENDSKNNESKIDSSAGTGTSTNIQLSGCAVCQSDQVMTQPMSTIPIGTIIQQTMITNTSISCVQFDEVVRVGTMQMYVTSTIISSTDTDTKDNDSTDNICQSIRTSDIPTICGCVVIDNKNNDKMDQKDDTNTITNSNKNDKDHDKDDGNDNGTGNDEGNNDNTKDNNDGFQTNLTYGNNSNNDQDVYEQRIQLVGQIGIRLQSVVELMPYDCIQRYETVLENILTTYWTTTGDESLSVTTSSSDRDTDYNDDSLNLVLKYGDYTVTNVIIRLLQQSLVRSNRTSSTGTRERTRTLAYGIGPSETEQTLHEQLQHQKAYLRHQTIGLTNHHTSAFNRILTIDDVGDTNMNTSTNLYLLDTVLNVTVSALLKASSLSATTTTTTSPKSFDFNTTSVQNKLIDKSAMIIDTLRGSTQGSSSLSSVSSFNDFYFHSVHDIQMIDSDGVGTNNKQQQAQEKQKLHQRLAFLILLVVCCSIVVGGIVGIVMRRQKQQKAQLHDDNNLAHDIYDDYDDSVSNKNRNWSTCSLFCFGRRRPWPALSRDKKKIVSKYYNTSQWRLSNNKRSNNNNNDSINSNNDNNIVVDHTTTMDIQPIAVTIDDTECIVPTTPTTTTTTTTTPLKEIISSMEHQQRTTTHDILTTSKKKGPGRVHIQQSSAVRAAMMDDHDYPSFYESNDHDDNTYGKNNVNDDDCYDFEYSTATSGYVVSAVKNNSNMTISAMSDTHNDIINANTKLHQNTEPSQAKIDKIVSNDVNNSTRNVSSSRNSKNEPIFPNTINTKATRATTSSKYHHRSPSIPEVVTNMDQYEGDEIVTTQENSAKKSTITTQGATVNTYGNKSTDQYGDDGSCNSSCSDDDESNDDGMILRNNPILSATLSSMISSIDVSLSLPNATAATTKNKVLPNSANIETIRKATTTTTDGTNHEEGNDEQKSTTNANKKSLRHKMFILSRGSNHSSGYATMINTKDTLQRITDVSSKYGSGPQRNQKRSPFPHCHEEDSSDDDDTDNDNDNDDTTNDDVESGTGYGKKVDNVSVISRDPSAFVQSRNVSTMIKRTIHAPPGKLGIILDSTQFGQVVREISPKSPLIKKLHVGDIIIAIDGVSTQSLSSIEITELMLRTAGLPKVFKVLHDP